MYRNKRGQILVESLFAVLLVIASFFLIFYAVKNRVMIWQKWWWQEEKKLCRQHNSQKICNMVFKDAMNGGHFLHRILMVGKIRNIHDRYLVIRDGYRKIRDGWTQIEESLKDLEAVAEQLGEFGQPGLYHRLNSEIREMRSLIRNAEKDLGDFSPGLIRKSHKRL